MWKISPVEKKSAIEFEHFMKDDQEIVYETGWRWSTCTSKEKPDLTNYDPEEGINVYDQEWELEESSDSCWSEWNFPDDMSDEEKSEIQDAWGDDWHEGIEKLGWDNTDTHLVYYGELEVTEVED